MADIGGPGSGPGGPGGLPVTATSTSTSSLMLPIPTPPPGQCLLPNEITPSMTFGIPMSGEHTFHDISVIVSGACMAFSVSCVSYLMWSHISNIKMPQEQTHILRICAFIPMYAIGVFIMVIEPNAYVWLECWLKVLEALALTWFYLLMHWLAVGEGDYELKEVFLQSLVVPAIKNQRPILEKFTRYRRQWTFVFQCPVVMVICAIATNITHSMNMYCLSDSSGDFAHLPISIIQIISIGAAVLAVIKSYMPMKEELQPHRTMSKLWAFKLLIGLQLLQNIIYSIMTSLDPNPLHPTRYLSLVDINIGIPMMIVSIEMVFFSIFYHYAYSVGPYQLHYDEPRALSGWRVWAAMLNQREILAGLVWVFTIGKNARDAAAIIGNDHVVEPAIDTVPRWQFWRRGGSSSSSPFSSQERKRSGHSTPEPPFQNTTTEVVPPTQDDPRRQQRRQQRESLGVTR